MKRLTITLLVGILGYATPSTLAQDASAESRIARLTEWTKANHPEESFSGEIHGVVHDLNGIPLPGAMVLLTSDSAIDLDEGLKSILTAHRRARPQSTITDAGGRYWFGNLAADIDYNLRCPQIDLHRRAVKAGDRATLLLPYLRSKPSRVIEICPTAGESALPAATITTSLSWEETWLHSPTRGGLWTAGEMLRGTDDPGPPFPRTLFQAFAHGLASQRQSVADSESPLDLLLSDATGLYGRVLHLDGWHQPRILIAAAGTDLSLHSRNQSPVHPATGFFQIVGLEPGEYSIGLADGGRIHQRWSVSVKPGFNRLAIATKSSKAQPPDTSLIQVLLPNGDPYLGSIDTTFWYKPGIQGLLTVGSDSPTARSRTGWYAPRVPPCVLKALAHSEDATLVVAVGVEGYGDDNFRGDAEIRFPAREWREPHTVRLPEMGSLAIEIPGYLGSGFEGTLSVRVLEEIAEPRKDELVIDESPQDRTGTWQRIPDYLGQGRLSHVREGSYRVICTYSGGSYSERFSYFEEPIEIGSGHQTVEIPLPKFTPVRIELPAESRGSKIYLSRTEPRNGRSQVIHTGRKQDSESVQLSLLPGQYCLQMDLQQMEFRVAETPLDLVFQPTVYRRYRVTSVIPNGYLHGLGLRADDHVIQIDRRNRPSTSPAQLLQRLWQTRDSVELSILRDGEPLTIVVEKAKLDAERVHLIGILEGGQDR